MNTTVQSSEVNRDEQDSSARAGDPSLSPAVDIYEDDHGIVLLADLPGVSKDALHIHVDRDSLRVEGEANIEMPEGIQAIYADVRATRFERSFTLSSELDTAHIDANLKDGVLTLRIPKREEVRPRRIQINPA